MKASSGLGRGALPLLATGLATGLVMGLAAPAALADAAACTALQAQGVPGATVSEAKFIAADAARKIPAHCELTAVISPTPRSRITGVYRLPEEWNGRMLGLGGGGWAGNIQPITAAPALARGYATAQTDGGHYSAIPPYAAPGSPETRAATADVSWVKGNPDAVTDFSHRAVHLMTVTGKTVVARYYGKAAERNYFQGCSTGGRMALMEAQRYPEDYDAIIAGAPVYTLLTQTSPIVRDRIFRAPGAAIPTALMTKVNQRVLAACDAKDGVTDGVVTDPRACDWDPASMQCPAGATGEDCLAAPQVQALRKAYTTTRGNGGRIANYALTRGGELTWNAFVPTTPGPRTPMNGSLNELTPLILGKRDGASFDPARDQAAVHATPFAKEYEAANPDLKPFLARGGKLIMWHGFDDGGPSPFATIDYYEAVKRVSGADSAVKLFIAPGVAHCRGGPGADDFDLLTALENWHEKGAAPVRIPARNVKSGNERPLCPWPALPAYLGTGDTRSAASYACRVP